MTAQLEFSVQYPHSPQQVWQAITQPKALASWLMENDFEPYLGHRFQFKEASLPGLEIIIDCEVMALEPPKKLVYTWQTVGMPSPSLVTWTLTPMPGGTQLQLCHSGLVKAESPLSAVSLLQNQDAGGQSYRQPHRQQHWQPPHAQLTLIASPSQQKLVQPVDVSGGLGSVIEAQWEMGLHTALPKFLLKTFGQDCTQENYL